MLSFETVKFLYLNSEFKNVEIEPLLQKSLLKNLSNKKQKIMPSVTVVRAKDHVLPAPRSARLSGKSVKQAIQTEEANSTNKNSS